MNQKLADELIEMVRVDQEMRLKYIEEKGEWDASIDERNEKRLREIVDKYGWPTIAMVGAEASYDAWLLAQHMSLESMERVLGLMKALPEGDIDPANMAYLEDRILMMHGKPQIYGTQFQRTDDGKIVSHPIKDSEYVDERRKSVGLDTLAEGEASMREMYEDN